MQGFFSQGMDNIISFVLCSIFGCVVLPWWTDNPVPAIIFSTCHKCSFCILRRAGTLWSFASAQQGREGQPAVVRNVRRQFKEQLWKIDLWLTPNTHPHTPSVSTWNESLNSYRKWDFGEELILHIKSLKAGRWHPMGVNRSPALLPKEKNALFQLFTTCPALSLCLIPSCNRHRKTLFP